MNRPVVVLRGPVEKRRVRTADGARYYKLPIGSPIVGHGHVPHPNIDGGGPNIDALIHDNPRHPDEPLFVWQSRLVDKLSPADKHEVLYRIREQYPPVDFVASGTSRWRKSHRLPEPRIDISKVRADPTKGDRVARAFEMTVDQAHDPNVRAAFADFVRQNTEMYDFVTRPRERGGLGISVTFVPNEPYPSARAQAEDVRRNHHISIQTGLGGVHSLMTTEQYDHFRAVHDIFGHVGIGGGFDRHGEYQAWLSHMSMYDGPGRDAMSSEYHGVNSALWSGAPGTPGTGRSVLLPPDLIRNPWDRRGRLVRKAAPGDDRIDHIIGALALGTAFAVQAESGPWHRLSPTVAGVAKMIGRPVVILRGPVTKTRHVRSADGARRYKLPIGSPIVAHPNAPGGVAHALAEAGQGVKPGGKGAPDVFGSKDKPIRATSIDEAAKLLGEGNYVEFDQPDQVSTLLDKLAAIVDDATRRGDKAPNYNLCKVTVKGTNLFCVDSKPIPRHLMPQLGGEAVPGSKADKLTRNKKGEVDVTSQFRDMLGGRGIGVKDTTVKASHLRATQSELKGGQVAGMVRAVKVGDAPNATPEQRKVSESLRSGRIFVSADNYIIDGHHRWAMLVGVDLADNKAGDVDMNVTQIDLPILKVLAIANNFTQSFGIRPKAAKRGQPPCIGCDDDVSKGFFGRMGAKLGHPFQGNQWTHGGTGGWMSPADAGRGGGAAPAHLAHLRHNDPVSIVHPHTGRKTMGRFRFFEGGMVHVNVGGNGVAVPPHRVVAGVHKVGDKPGHPFHGNQWSKISDRLAHLAHHSEYGPGYNRNVATDYHTAKSMLDQGRMDEAEYWTDHAEMRAGTISFEEWQARVAAKTGQLFKSADDSIMVALYPPPDVAAALALPGGEPPEELHVTLAFLGKIADQPATRDEIAAALMDVADESDPLSGTYNGIGRFTADDRGEGWPLVALPDVPDLADFRTDLVDALDEIGADVADNHGFTPHTTLAYVTPADESAAAAHLAVGIDAQPVTFDSVWLCWGSDRVEIPLGTSGSHGDAYGSYGVVDGPVYAATAVSKADETKQFTLGPLYPATDAPKASALDAHKEFASSADLQAGVWDYVRKGDRSIRLQHTSGTEIGECVEVMCMPGPVTVPLRLPTGEVVEKSFAAGTPFMGVVWNHVGWPLVQKGLIRGFSFGGTAQRLVVDLED